jgi:UDP-N-acetylmuramate--alanine ligase
LESCEYRRHFLAYHPDYAVITNIDFDHPDYFSDPDDVKRAFQEMARQVKKGIVACGDDPATLELEAACPILNYGFGEINHLRARNVTRNVGGTAFDAWDGSRKLGRFHIPLHGDHNVLNTLAVIGICLLEGLDLGRVASRLPAFPGVRRRFAEKPYASNVVIDDYAHHPNEVKATIQAARSKYPHKPLVVIFQPHTYSRLKHFLDGFAASLAEADELYLCDIFGSAREADGNVSIHSLLAKLPRARHLTRENISDLLEHRESVLLFMGAGDIQKYQRWMMEME